MRKARLALAALLTACSPSPAAPPPPDALTVQVFEQSQDVEGERMLILRATSSGAVSTWAVYRDGDRLVLFDLGYHGELGTARLVADGTLALPEGRLPSLGERSAP